MKALTPRTKRLLAYLAICLAAVGWDKGRRHWSPDITVTMDHYVIYSTATPEQTREIGVVDEILYTRYITFLHELGSTPQSHGELKMKLFRDRDEFRFCNRVRGWAEAFYRRPYCYQYYSAGEANPYHWMTHEATHQLNAEVAGFDLAKWLEEGVAAYFSTSRVIGDRLSLGEIDPDTYPVWGIDILATSGELQSDKRNVSVIPLRSIVSGSGGPDMDDFVNLYYLHWWSLTHFLLNDQDGKYRDGLARLLHSDGDVSAFERHIGDIENIEQKWYEYVLDLKRQLAARPAPTARPRQLRSNP